MSTKRINLSNSIISEDTKPFIIAEMSGNHNRSIERALKIVELAAKSGAHALKLQTYTPDTMTIKGAFTISDSKSLWNGKELYDLYSEAFTPWEWHKQIFDYSKSLGLVPFSTPFDETAVDFLETLGVEMYKIASFENTDWPLLKYVATTNKPVIMSTGAATLSQIDEAVNILKKYGKGEVVLLKCTSTYPASPENTNLITIAHMRQLFDCLVGLSDHTMGIGAAIASVALGASVIEKHFTISREDGGVDSAFSIEPHELKSLVVESERAYLALGKIQYGIQEDEKPNLKFKRSLFAVKNIAKGESFTNENVKVLRPATGLEPKYFDILKTMKASRDITAGSSLTWDNI
jgi:pseudaminic acid synthase